MLVCSVAITKPSVAEQPETIVFTDDIILDDDIIMDDNISIE